jgi:pimeloyl-ACP methyl ester carboxylesterase
MRCLIVALLLLVSVSRLGIAQQPVSPPANGCGEVITIETHNRTITRYTLTHPPAVPQEHTRVALVLIVGGDGNLGLTDKGCATLLSRNVLMRIRSIFHKAGFVTALVDAPSDAQAVDGLAGFRTEPQHAEDLGKIITDVRTRTKASVWLLGHSRGTISAANGAARLSGSAAPDGLVLLSAIMSGDPRARKRFVAQTVFDVPLESIKMAVLVVGHAADNCIRSPAALMADVTAQTEGVREQTATVTGGPIAAGRMPNLSACEVGEPHDYVGQEAEVAARVISFIRGGSY